MKYCNVGATDSPSNTKIQDTGRICRPYKHRVSTQVSYRRGNDKKHRRGVLHTPNIESLYLIELIFIRAYAIRPYDLHHNVIVLAWEC